MIGRMTDPEVHALDEVIARLISGLKTNVYDLNARYAQTIVPGGDESDVLDVLIQTAASSSIFALWHGEGLPKSCDDDGFAAAATCTRTSEGSVIASYQEVRADEEAVPYEIVRILVAFRIDGLVVTVNRYADPASGDPLEPWEFHSLQA